MKKHYTHVIWDFNGTILDDMWAGIDSVNEMLSARGLPVIGSVEQYRSLFGFPIRDYYRRLGFDFAKEDYESVLAPLWVSLYNEKSKSSPLFSGVEPLCRALRDADIHQSILSASQCEMMRDQLAARGALGWFDEIWGNDSIHAYGKEGLAKAWRSAHPAACAVLIGDTVHDFEIATLLGADCILVAAGHQDRERLLSCGVPVVDDLSLCATLILNKDA